MFAMRRVPLTRCIFAALRCVDLSPQAGRGKLWRALAPIVALLFVAPAPAQTPQIVDLALVLAVDASGSVDRVRFDPKNYRAVVTMSIDQGYPFSKDTIASILTSGLLGEVYIGLDAGGDTQMLADGGVITKTQSAVVLEKLIGQFLFDKASTLGGGK